MLDWVLVGLFTWQLQGGVMATAEAYMTAFEARDADKLRTFYTAKTVFEDPTSGIYLVGADAIHQQQKEVWFTYSVPGSDKNQYVKKFASGDRAIFVYDLVFTGNPDKFKPARSDLAFTFTVVTILKIEMGKVVHHLEFLNARGFFEQLEAYGVQMQ